MLRRQFSFGLVVALLLGTTAASASELTGTYLESRTCQVYTGPCFANGESGLAGKEAVMAWNIEQGVVDGVDVSGLSVVVVVTASDTLGFRGLENAARMRSLLIVDEQASPEQREALQQFVKDHAGKAGQSIVKTAVQPIAMSLDVTELRGRLTAGERIKITTRRAQAGDCICGNETAYYPPLASLQNFAPGVAVDFDASGLNRAWSAPESRSAYVGLFAY